MSRADELIKIRIGQVEAKKILTVLVAVKAFLSSADYLDLEDRVFYLKLNLARIEEEGIDDLMRILVRLIDFDA